MKMRMMSSSLTRMPGFAQISVPALVAVMGQPMSKAGRSLLRAPFA